MIQLNQPLRADDLPRGGTTPTVSFVQLTKGLVSIVDMEDSRYVSRFNWHVRINQTVNYAARETGSRLYGTHVRVYLHRFIWELHNGPIPSGLEIDHIDGDGLNNSLSNLRACTHKENAANRHDSKKGCTSRFKGVSWDKPDQKWVAEIRNLDGHFHLGRYVSEIDAAKAYDKKAKESYGDFAHLNFPEGSQ